MDGRDFDARRGTATLKKKKILFLSRATFLMIADSLLYSYYSHLYEHIILDTDLYDDRRYRMENDIV